MTQETWLKFKQNLQCQQQHGQVKERIRAIHRSHHDLPSIIKEPQIKIGQGENEIIQQQSRKTNNANKIRNERHIVAADNKKWNSYHKLFKTKNSCRNFPSKSHYS